MKKYTAFHRNPAGYLPEKRLVQKISSLSQEIKTDKDLAIRELKKAQREYYLNELVQRDEIIKP